MTCEGSIETARVLLSKAPGSMLEEHRQQLAWEAMEPVFTCHAHFFAAGTVRHLALLNFREEKDSDSAGIN